MSVDDSATSDQQEQAQGAESDVRKHELPVQTGNPVGATETQPAQNNEPVLTRASQAGVTDADWHNPNLPVPAPKSKDELMEHLSEALADMASDFTELPVLAVPTDIVVNRPAKESTTETANARAPQAVQPNSEPQSAHPPAQQPPPQTTSQSQPAIPPQPENAGPSQQIRSSLPPGSLSSQTNPQLTLPVARDPSAPPQSQSEAPPPQGDANQTEWVPPPNTTQSPPVPSASALITGDHPPHVQQRPLPPAQHYFVLEGLAPPSTPGPDEIQHERKIQFEVTGKIPVEPKDGLQIRRLIATQQGMAAAQNPNQQTAPGQPNQPNDANNPQERNFEPSEPQLTPPPAEQSPTGPARPPTQEPVKAVGTSSGTNQVQLPPMFGGRSANPPKDTEPASDEDQQKAHTGLQALPGLVKPPGSKSSNDLRQPTGPIQTTTTNGGDESAPAKPLLTGHNFQPRQSDPRSSMSALKAMPAPVPAAPGPNQPVSPLGAALASSLPSNPPTGQHIVPPGLREPPQPQPKPQAPPAVAQEQEDGIAPPLSNPLGPANSRPIPSLDGTGAVRPTQSQGNSAQPKSNPLGPPANPLGPPINPLGAPGAPFPATTPSTTGTATNPLGPPAAPFAPAGGSNAAQPGPMAPPVVSYQHGLPAQAQQQDIAIGPTPTNGPTDSDNDMQAFGTTHYQSAPQENVTEQLYQKPSGIVRGIAPTTEITGPRPVVQPIATAPTLPAAQKLSALVPPGAPGHQPLGSQPRAAVKPGSQQVSGSYPGFQSQQGSAASQGVQPPQGSIPVQGSLSPQGSTPPQGSMPPQGSPPPQGFMPPQGSIPPQGMPSPQQTNSRLPSHDPSTTPPQATPNPQLFPIKQNSSARSTHNDLREETGLVLPHSAPEPHPNQRISEEFGRSAIPGVTPVSKPFETAQGKERREAKEREVEALNRIQLPAKVDRAEESQDESSRPPREQERSKSTSAPAAASSSKEPPKSRKQSDPGRAERFANLLHDVPPNSGSPGDGKKLRASQSGGGVSGIVDWIKNQGRLALVALLVVPLVLSVSAVIFIKGNSLIGVSMSPSQRAGEEAFTEGNYDRAVNYFNEAIKADSKRSDLYHDRARANLRLQKYAAAVSDYSSALELDKNFSSARLDRAAAYYWLGDYTKAISDYDELIKSDPNNIDAYFGRGLSYSKLKDYTPALADLNKVVQINPRHPGAFEDIANAYLAQGKLSDAVDAYSHSLKNNPRDANPLYMRANTYKRLGKTAEALSDFSSAIELAPGRYEFYNDRGFAQFESGKYKDAITDLSIALQLNPNYEIAKHNRKAACNKLIAAIGPSPKTPEAIGDLAYAYYNLENYSNALAAANKALLLNGQYRPALNIRAAIELKEKHFEYALTDADNVLKIKSDDKDAMLTRARAYLNLGRYERAIKDYDSCVSENDNTSLFALRERALAHLLANEGALAAKDAQQFLELNGWNNSLSGPTVLLSWLAKRQLQDLDGANASLSKAETRLKATQWPYGILKFLKREITLTDLNNSTRNDRERTDVRTWLGFDHMLGGLRDEARGDFEWVKKYGYQDNDDYLLANEQLKADVNGNR